MGRRALTYHTNVIMYHAVTQKRRSREEPMETESEPTPETISDGKKERVLHTRVPAVLEQELKRFADNLRIPVSNLVRTILEDALEVADVASDRVEERLRKAAEQLEQERTKLKRRVHRGDPLAAVFAFQEVSLAQQATCAKCGARLEPGTRAFLGLTDATPGRQAPRIFACAACLPGQSSSTPEKEEKPS